MFKLGICHSFRSPETCHLLPPAAISNSAAELGCPEEPARLSWWRRGVVHVETAPMGGGGHEIPHCIAVHSASISIHQHPVYSNIIQYQRGLSQFKRELYIEICFVYSCLVNLCELYEHPPHDESSVQGDEIGQLKISQSPNTWM